MSKLDELIKEYCSDGVEYTKISDITKVLRGKRLTKKELSDEYIYPVYHGGLEPLGFYNEKNRDGDTVMIINVGASAGTVGYSDKDFWSSDGCFCLEHTDKALSKFLYSYLATKQPSLVSKVRHAGIPTLDASVIENVAVPLPALPVQRELVRVLDEFTLLSAELAAELAARKKQYEYYRDELLTFKTDVEKSPLKDVATISRGKRLVRDELSEDSGYPVYQNSLTPLGYYDNYNCEENKTFVISAGAAGEVGFSKEPFWAADDCLFFGCSDKLTERYLYHYLMNNYSYLKSQVRKSSVPRLSREVIENLEIVIPSISVQNRITNVLDNFDAICSDLKIGLPAEIEARQQQYEYYRDKLLDFKELKSK